MMMQASNSRGSASRSIDVSGDLRNIMIGFMIHDGADVGDSDWGMMSMRKVSQCMLDRDMSYTL